mgnify:CR=1 FL=1
MLGERNSTTILFGVLAFGIGLTRTWGINAPLILTRSRKELKKREEARRFSLFGFNPFFINSETEWF